MGRDPVHHHLVLLLAAGYLLCGLYGVHFVDREDGAVIRTHTLSHTRIEAVAGCKFVSHLVRKETNKPTVLGAVMIKFVSDLPDRANWWPHNELIVSLQLLLLLRLLRLLQCSLLQVVVLLIVCLIGCLATHGSTQP